VVISVSGDAQVSAVFFWEEPAMAEPVRARRLTDEEGRTLLRIVRRGRNSTIKVRRAVIIMASASGNTNEAIAALVAADPDTVRDVIHAFNDRGLECLSTPDHHGRRDVHRQRRSEAAQEVRHAVHPLEPAQARRLPQPSTGRGTPGDHRPRAAAGAVVLSAHALTGAGFVVDFRELAP
jgi:hypothetical protein